MNTLQMNSQVTTTSVTQTANEILGTQEKKLYYLIIKNQKGEQLTVNVGEKTHDKVQKLTEVVTKAQILEPNTGGKK